MFIRNINPCHHYLSISMQFVSAGLGFGMIYLPAIVSVTCYFDKYRSLATGIAVCGSGLGTFIFAPLVDHLVKEYGWRITVAVISGLVFLCILFGMLFRPLNTSTAYGDGDEDGEIPALMNRAATTTVVLNIIEPPTTEGHPLKNGGGSVDAATRSYEHIANLDDDDEWRNASHDQTEVSHDALLLSDGRRKSKGSASVTAPSNAVANSTAASFGNDLDRQSRFTLSQPELIAASGCRNSCRLNTRKRNEVCYASQNLKPSANGGSGIMYQKDIFYSGSLVNINVNRRRLVYYAYAIVLAMLVRFLSISRLTTIDFYFIKKLMYLRTHVVYHNTMFLH